MTNQRVHPSVSTEVWPALPAEQQQPLVQLLAQLAVKYVLSQRAAGQEEAHHGHADRSA